MGKNIKRKHSPEFKTKVCLESIKERLTISEISKKYNLHPTQIKTWKKDFLECAPELFKTDKKREENKDQESLIKTLYAEIGEQKVSLDFLKKNFTLANKK